MSRSVNKVILLGNVGSDPAIRFTPSGAIVATLSLATNERAKNAQGNWEDRPEWHNLAAYAKQAELVRDYVKKGAKLYVEGKLQTRSWEANGAKQYRTEIIISQFIFTSEPVQAETTQARPASPHPEAPRKTLTQELEETEISDEDVPF